MTWRTLAPHAAEGAILTRTLHLPDRILRKGTRLDPAACEALAQAGIEAITVDTLGPGDIGENDAANIVAAALAGDGITAGRASAGRVDLIGAANGMVDVDRAALDRLNALDEAITVATLPPDSVVAAGDVVATIKIIPFTVPRTLADEAARIASPILVRRFRPLRAILIQTILPDTKAALLAKTAQVTADRLARHRASLMERVEIAHECDPMARALADAATRHPDLILIAGAAAIMGRADTIPQALEAAGGAIVRLGMPVEPGNLLMLGDLHGIPVIGMPGCARSPVDNGIDLVLRRLAAGLTVDSAVIGRMGVGGLLPGRERPAMQTAGITALVLAAGLSQRMGADHKLLLPLGSKPLVRHAVETLQHAAIEEIVVVTGHRASEIENALAGTAVRFVHNADFAAGMGGSLAAGAAAAGDSCDGILVCLGDMPLVTPATVTALVAAFAPARGRDICIPVFQSRRGHPILFAARYRDRLQRLRGDAGARRIVEAEAAHVVEVPVEDPGILADADTPEDFARIAGAGSRDI
jgi:molybdenum cofactor cytidylyltransferase